MKGSNQKRVQLLTSTMGGRLLRKSPQSAANPSTLIIDQRTTPPLDAGTENHIIISGLGLSRSRNAGIRHATAPICLICDDDTSHPSDVEKILEQTFAKHDADIITFKIKTPEGDDFKQYSATPFIHNRRSLLRVNSIEIAFRLSSINTAGITFDERFGLGAEFVTGEEIIFLQDALRAGLRAKYVPISIVTHPKESSGADLYLNNKLIEAKGAMLYRAFGASGYLASVAFALRKYKESGYSLLRFGGLMLTGIQKYKRGAGVTSTKS